MNIDLKGKNALVCGASKGIGKATAYALSKLGACVTLVARSAELLSEISQDLDKNRVHDQQDHDYLVLDLLNADELRKRVRTLTLKRTYHILINNTGGPAAGPITEATPEAFLKAFQQHLVANHLLVQLLSPGMKEASYGRIINIVSTSVKTPINGLGVSNTTRGAVANWSKTMATELAPFGITLNNVLPGSTDTERLRSLMSSMAERKGISNEEEIDNWKKGIPMQRFGTAEEVANAAAFLASPAASYITGTNITVDGGRTQTL
ncbi:MAG: SDR family oxidoreductase [Bacteroidota bacterium]